MALDPHVHLPQIPLPLFTLSLAQTGGRKARKGFAFQDQFIASVLASFLASKEEFLAARIEGVEDLDTLIRTKDGWLERYYQIKSKHEGGGRWTLAALDREGIWTRFFSLYRMFLQQQFETTRKIEFVVSVEGDLDPELIELRERGPAAVSARTKLLSLLMSGLRDENPSRDPSEIHRVVSTLLDGFISTIRLDSRISNLRDTTFARLIAAGDISPSEADQACGRLLAAIERESGLAQPTLLTLALLREWLGIRERALLQKKPVPEPYEVNRNALVENLLNRLKNESTLLLYGIPRVGKSHIVSALIDQLEEDQNYFWFTFSGTEGDEDRFLFQLGSWAGQRTGILQLGEDLERLQPEAALDRLKKIPVNHAYLVLDDCHKASDKAFLPKVADLVRQGWTCSKIILIGEKRIPEVQASGIPDLQVTGLEPKESILLLMKLGIDVRGALTELGLLSIQADGHPAFLKAIASELPPRPSAEEVTKLSQTLTSALSVRPFLEVLSESLLKSLRTDAQQRWMRRLAVLTFPFRRDLANRVAEIEPRIEVGLADWNYLASQLLDQAGPEQYSVPALLRPLLTSPGHRPNAEEILTVSARHVFRTASATSRVDFWEFHGAIISLVIAGHHDEAAAYFLLSLRSSMRVGTFSPFELLFMLLNGEPVQGKFQDNFARFSLLFSELQMRLQFEASLNFKRAIALLRRMRIVPKEGLTKKALVYTQVMVHVAVCSIRIRRIKDANRATIQEGRRAFIPIQTALRIAVHAGDADFVQQILKLYIDLSFLEREPELELLKQAILMTPAGSLTESGNDLTNLYTSFVASKKYDDSALALCERHSKEFREAGQGDAFLASEHAVATILHNRFSRYRDARERIRTAVVEAHVLRASPDADARADLLVADSYWAEKDYAGSVEYYAKAMAADLGDETLNQWSRERVVDSLILLRRHEEAVMHLVAILRSGHNQLSPEFKARFYARLAYAYAECGSLRKASVACFGLCRLARQAGLAEIDRLSSILTGWVLQHFDYSDPAIPKSNMQIRDSSALSENATPEEMKTWKSSGPAQVRGLMLLGTLFELLGDFRRSEFLYCRAIEASAILDEEENTRLERLYFFQLRVARVQIRRHMVTKAADMFRSAVEGLTSLRQRQDGVTNTQAGAAAFAIATLVEPCFQSSSDSELTQFFAELDKRFASQPAVRGWLRFKESELLFGRLMVQAAKRALQEAETLARSCDQPRLLWSVLHTELFVHMEQMYRNQTTWFSDVLQAGLMLARDKRLTEKQVDFGAVVARFSAQFVTPMGDIATTISSFGERANRNPFLFTMLAIWKIARRNFPTLRCLAEVEQELRSTGTLDAADFD